MVKHLPPLRSAPLPTLPQPQRLRHPDEALTVNGDDSRSDVSCKRVAVRAPADGLRHRRVPSSSWLLFFFFLIPPTPRQRCSTAADVVFRVESAGTPTTTLTPCSLPMSTDNMGVRRSWSGFRLTSISETLKLKIALPSRTLCHL